MFMKYSSLGRKMNTEVRLSYKKICVSVCAILFLFIYVFNKKSCISQPNQIAVSSSVEPIIYCITPTYNRPVQKAELTRLSHVFRLVPNLFWVLVEDAEKTSDIVKNLINRARLSDRSVIINVKTPTDHKLTKKDPHWSKPRGVDQRNLAISWLRKRLKVEPGHAIVYFMDDDNSYDTELFTEISKLKRGKVGVWPVGLVGALNVEKPVVKNEKVIGFNSMWKPERPFPIDMAGFAISFDLLESNEVMFSYKVENGYQETEILRQITTLDELQPLSDNKILVWHTRTEKSKNDNELKLQKKGKPPSDAEMYV